MSLLREYVRNILLTESHNEALTTCIMAAYEEFLRERVAGHISPSVALKNWREAAAGEKIEGIESLAVMSWDGDENVELMAECLPPGTRSSFSYQVYQSTSFDPIEATAVLLTFLRE